VRQVYSDLAFFSESSLARESSICGGGRKGRCLSSGRKGRFLCCLLVFEIGLQVLLEEVVVRGGSEFQWQLVPDSCVQRCEVFYGAYGLGGAAGVGWVGGVMVLLVGVSGVVVVNVGGESVGVVVFGAVLRV